MSNPAVGIDLGTTYSMVACINATGQPEVIRTPDGRASIPSVVCCGEDPPLVGEAAKNLQAGGETEIAAFFKRSMGDPQFLLHMGARRWSPVDLSAAVLRALKENAELALNSRVVSAVVTVPAYFHNQQREATIEAGQRAGLEVRKIINEPTAAALAYGLHSGGRHGRVLVYDLGGGTFDVSLVEITPDEIGVMASAGDHQLGGKDWDDRIAAHLAERFAALHGIDPLEDNVSFYQLLTQAEAAKRSLSVRDSVPVVVQHGGYRETLELTRPAMEDMTRGLMERTQRLVEKVLEDVGQRWNDLAGVLLVGGSTRMRMVHEYVTQMSGQPPMSGVNVDEAVALGAAIQAQLEMESQGPQPKLGLRAAERPTPTFFLAGKRRIRDVTAHSLGVIAESADGSRFVNSRIVARNTTVPAAGEREYEIHVKPGTQIECAVYVTEGESEDPRQVSVRGKYVCTGTAGTASTMAKLRVQYAYDANSTIHVTACEAASGKLLRVSSEPVDDLGWLSKSPRELQKVDLTAIRLMTSPPAVDDIGQILSTLGLQFETYGQETRRLDCDVLFLNCCSNAVPQPDEVRKFVERGGSVYASCYMDTLIKAAFPNYFHFGGHTGRVCTMRAEVVDPDLIEVLGKAIDVTFDTVWATLDSVAASVRVLLRSKPTGKPLMVMAEHGKGTIFFTCFHNRAQVSEHEQKLLQMLVLKQISLVSGLPIELVASSKGLRLR